MLENKKLLETTNILRTKCIIAGDSCVGKTALTQVFVNDGMQFPKNYTLTCGVDLKLKSVNIPEANDVVEFFIYDSSGKDLFLDILLKYWKGLSVICLVFDVTNEASLESCQKWYQLIEKVKPDGIIPGVLIGNKVDLKGRRVVTPKAGMDAAKALNLVYFESSAKENQGIEEPFFYLANEWHKLYLDKTSSFKTVT